MAGKLVMQTELEGAGRSPAAFMGSLTGFGNVTLERAQLGGLNPGVFGAVNRAIELGVPLGGNRIREFVTGMLDSAPLPVARASATIGVSAGQARFTRHLGAVDRRRASGERQRRPFRRHARCAADAQRTCRRRRERSVPRC